MSFSCDQLSDLMGDCEGANPSINAFTACIACIDLHQHCKNMFCRLLLLSCLENYLFWCFAVLLQRLYKLCINFAVSSRLLHLHAILTMKAAAVCRRCAHSLQRPRCFCINHTGLNCLFIQKIYYSCSQKLYFLHT